MSWKYLLASLFQIGLWCCIIPILVSSRNDLSVLLGILLTIVAFNASIKFATLTYLTHWKKK